MNEAAKRELAEMILCSCGGSPTATIPAPAPIPAPEAASGAAATSTTNVRERTDYMVDLQSFSGEEQDWPDWHKPFWRRRGSSVLLRS